MVDPGGEWSWRSVGAALGGFIGRFIGGRSGSRIGAAIGRAVGSAVDYVSGYVGIRWNRGHSGGGYGFAGHNAARVARQNNKPAPRPVTVTNETRYTMDPAKANSFQRNFLGTAAGKYWYGRTGSYGFSSVTNDGYWQIKIGSFSWSHDNASQRDYLGVSLEWGIPAISADNEETGFYNSSELTNEELRVYSHTSIGVRPLDHHITCYRDLKWSTEMDIECPFDISTPTVGAGFGTEFSMDFLPFI